ncbi:MAG TPA: hypothetical protein V6C82_00915, partial [Chroococcales cyanobacterium]
IPLDGRRSFTDPTIPSPLPSVPAPGSLSVGASILDGPVINVPAGRVSGNVPVTQGDTTYLQEVNQVPVANTGQGEGGGRFHVYYAERKHGEISLDHDDIDGYGPETITLAERKAGVYRYAVHNYTCKSEKAKDFFLAGSDAQVKVYQGCNLLASFNVPKSKEGTLWTVFQLDNGVVTPLNRMSYESNEATAP